MELLIDKSAPSDKYATCHMCSQLSMYNLQVGVHTTTNHNDTIFPNLNDCHDKLIQLDGNTSLSSLSSLPNSSICSGSLSETLSGSSHLSSFLPFANVDISYDDISACDTLFTQGTLDPSVLSITNNSPVHLPPPISKKALTAQSLPNIMVTNHRSVFPKFNSLIDELIECEMHIGLHSEIWEEKEKVEHKNKIEEAFELHGILYISNPRPKRRGGGAAITLCDMKNQFTLASLPICVPPVLILKSVGGSFYLSSRLTMLVLLVLSSPVFLLAFLDLSPILNKFLISNHVTPLVPLRIRSMWMI